MAPPRIASVLAGLGATLALAACSSSSATNGSVNVGSSRLGAILVDRAGRALYLFGSDKPGKSACSGPCARVWPPATVSGRPIPGKAVSAVKLGTIRRVDHTFQLTYNGHPLYTFSGDTGHGQINGEGFLGSWFVVSPAGQKIVDPRAPAAVSGY
jgi:predicted lipoprotein with Yx(FWY)xxD motif